MTEDPIYYWIGWKYRYGALEWLGRKYPGAACAFRDGESHFRRGSYAAIVVNPGMVVCSLAGASRVPPFQYLALNLCGVLLRLGLIRGLCSAFPDQVELALSMAQEYLPLALVGAVAFAVFSLHKLYGNVQEKGRRRGVQENKRLLSP